MPNSRNSRKKRGAGSALSSLGNSIASAAKGTMQNFKTAIVGDNTGYGARTSIQQGAKTLMQALKPKRAHRAYGTSIKTPSERKLARGMKGHKD